MTVGSHTHTHALFDRAPFAQVEADLGRSIGLITDRLGVAPSHFAYPKALAGSSAATAAVRRRFRSAPLAGTRANPYSGTDPYRLSRSPVQRGDGMRWFRHKVRGGMRLEGHLRSMHDRRRYTGRTT